MIWHISYSIIDTVAPSTTRTTRTTRHDPTSHCDILFPSEKYRISSTWGDQKMVGSSWKMVGLHGIMGVWETPSGATEPTKLHLSKPGSLLRNLENFRNVSRIQLVVANQPQGWGMFHHFALPCWFEGWPQWSQTQFQHDSWSVEGSSHLRFRLSVQAMVPGLSCSTPWQLTIWINCSIPLYSLYSLYSLYISPLHHHFSVGWLCDITILVGQIPNPLHRSPPISTDLHRPVWRGLFQRVPPPDPHEPGSACRRATKSFDGMRLIGIYWDFMGFNMIELYITI